MPTVPIEENRVGLAAVTDAKLRPGDYTGTGLQAVGSGLATLGEALGGVSKDLQKKQQLVAARRASDQAAADAALKQGYNAYDGAARGLLRAGGGYLTQFGQAAVEAADSVSAALSRIPDEIRKTMQPHVRDLFDGVIGQRVEQDIAGVRAHADAQKNVWQGQQAEQLMEASAANALDHLGTPLFVDHVATGLKALDDRAAVQGWDPVVKGAAELGYISGIHTQAIDRLTLTDAIGAERYYRAHRQEMTAADQAKVEESLHAPLLERQGAAMVDDYGASLAQPDDGPAMPYAPRRADLPALRDHIEQQDLPDEVKAAALAEADARAAQTERRIKQDQRVARDGAFALTDRLGDGFTSVTQLPPDIRRALDPETLDALTRQAGVNARPEPVEPLGEAAHRLVKLAATDQPAFVEADLRLYRDQVTPDEYDALIAAQQGWRASPPAIPVVTGQRAWEAIGQKFGELGIGSMVPGSRPLSENAVFTAGTDSRLTNIAQNGSAAKTPRATMAPRSKWPATIDLNRHLGPVSPDEPKLRIPFKPESGREPLTATQFNQAKRNTAAMSARPDLMRARTIAKQRAADAGPGGHDQEYFYRLARGIPIVQNPPTVVPTPAQLRDAKRWGLDKVEMDRFVRGLPPLGWPQPIINYALLSREEGKQHLDAYPLPGKRDSGATIATGVDLGHQSAARLIRIGVPKELVTRLNEYFGRKGVDAVKYLKENPLSINQDQADILDEKIQSDDLKGLIKIFNDDSKVGEFVELPIAAQSALASLYHHMNRGLKFNQKELWGYLTTGQWQSAVDHLDRMKEYSKRRKNEAKVLKGAIDLGAMPAFSVQK